MRTPAVVLRISWDEPGQSGIAAAGQFILLDSFFTRLLLVPRGIALIRCIEIKLLLHRYEQRIKNASLFIQLLLLLLVPQERGRVSMDKKQILFGTADRAFEPELVFLLPVSPDDATLAAGHAPEGRLFPTRFIGRVHPVGRQFMPEFGREDTA